MAENNNSYENVEKQEVFSSGESVDLLPFTEH